MAWGTSSPGRLYQDVGSYGLDPDLGAESVMQAFSSVARSTTPTQRVVDGIPVDIAKRVGIHNRLMDKVVKKDNRYEMSTDTWHSIEARGLRYIQQCIDMGEPLFICSDDPEYSASLVADIRVRGGDVAIAHPVKAHRQEFGYDALVDFCALSRCKRIVQMTKYSTFSIAASIVGNIPIVNLYIDDKGVGTGLDIWRSVLPKLEHVGE